MFHINTWPDPWKVVFVCIDASHPSQQFFSHVRTNSCLPGLNPYLAVGKVSFSRTQYSVSALSKGHNIVSLPDVSLKIATF